MSEMQYIKTACFLVRYWLEGAEVERVYLIDLPANKDPIAEANRVCPRVKARPTVELNPRGRLVVTDYLGALQCGAVVPVARWAR